MVLDGHRMPVRYEQRPHPSLPVRRLLLESSGYSFRNHKKKIIINISIVVESVDVKSCNVFMSFCCSSSPNPRAGSSLSPREGSAKKPLLHRVKHILPMPPNPLGCVRKAVAYWCQWSKDGYRTVYNNQIPKGWMHTSTPTIWYQAWHCVRR